MNRKTEELIIKYFILNRSYPLSESQAEELALNLINSVKNDIEYENG